MEKDPLYDLLVTESDRQELLSFLDKIKEDVFKSGVDVKKEISESKFSSGISNHISPDMDPTQITNKIEELVTAVEALPVLKVILAVKPTEQTTRVVSEFAQTKYGTKYILSFDIDPKILGGVILIENGKYTDLSVATKLSKAFEGKDINSLITN